MLWLLAWLPLCSFFLLDKIGLFGSMMLLDRLIPSFELLKRNTYALATSKPLSVALDRPARLPSYDRYTLFSLSLLGYHTALITLNLERNLWIELAISLITIPQVQQRAIKLLSGLIAWRDGKAKRLAAKCVVRSIKALSQALIGQPAMVHSQDVLPHIDKAYELLWQVGKHAAMTSLLLYIKRYSRRSYYVALKYCYFYQIDQLRQPSAKQARLKLIELLDRERWSEFGTAKTFNLIMILFHQGEPEIPQWIATFNFGIARFFAVWTLMQGLGAWNPQWTAIGCLFALLLVERAELAAYWKTCLAVTAAIAATLMGSQLWIAALISTSRPLWFGTRSVIKFLIKRLHHAVQIQLPAFWLFSALILQHSNAIWLLIYSININFHATVGVALIYLLGILSDHQLGHLLSCALLFSVAYTLISYSFRTSPPPVPKISTLTPFRIIDNYKAT